MKKRSMSMKKLGITKIKIMVKIIFISGIAISIISIIVNCGVSSSGEGILKGPPFLFGLLKISIPHL
jgi:hypothetical protein